MLCYMQGCYRSGKPGKGREFHFAQFFFEIFQFSSQPLQMIIFWIFLVKYKETSFGSKWIRIIFGENNS